MRKITVYFDVNSQTLYGEGKLPVGDNTKPYIRYREKIQLEVHYVTEAVNFTPYTGFAGVAISSSAAVDNDWTHYLEGALAGAKTGAVVSIAVNGLASEPPSSGFLRLTNGAGQTESVAYTGIALNSNTYVFTVNTTLTYTYAQNDEVQISDKLLLKADTIDESAKATGVFVFTLNANNLSYYKLINGVSEISGCLFEHKVLDSNSDLIFVAQFDFVCKNIVDDGSSTVPPAPSADFYNKTEVDALISDFIVSADISADYYNKTEIDATLGDYYLKTEVDTLLGDYYLKTETYSKTETDDAIEAIQNANLIEFSPPADMVATDVQGAVEEVNTKINEVAEMDNSVQVIVLDGSDYAGLVSWSGGKFTLTHNSKRSILLTAYNNYTAAAAFINDGDYVGQRISILVEAHVVTFARALSTVDVDGDFITDNGVLDLVWNGNLWKEVSRSFRTTNLFIMYGKPVGNGVGSKSLTGPSSATGANALSMGPQSIAEADNSFAMGTYAWTNHKSSFAHSGGCFDNQLSEKTDNQIVRFNLFGQTTDGNPTELTSPQRFILEDNMIYACSLVVAGRKTDGSDVGMYRRSCLIKRLAGTVTLEGSVQTPTGLSDIESAGATAWDIAITADDINKSLKVAVTGQAATTIHWSVLIEAVQLG